MITAYESLERVLTLQLNTARVPQIYSPKLHAHYAREYAPTLYANLTHR